MINSNSVKFDPNPISVQLDSFDMSFEVVNLGQRSNKNMLVEVLQELPDGEPFYLVSDSIQAPAFKETFSYRLPTLGSRALGANKIFIEIESEISCQLNIIGEGPQRRELEDLIVKFNLQKINK